MNYSLKNLTLIFLGIHSFLMSSHNLIAFSASYSKFLIAFCFIFYATANDVVKTEIILAFFAFGHWVAVSFLRMTFKTDFFYLWQSLPPQCPFFNLRSIRFKSFSHI